MSGRRHATVDDWITLLPEFADDNPDFLQVWLDATDDAINISCWGSKSCTAHVFLAAHMLTVVNPSSGAGVGEVGPIKRKEIDKLEVEYSEAAESSQLDSHFATTRYGRNYLTLRSTLLVLPLVGRRILNRPPVVC